MADFKLSAEIEMQAAQALREIDKVKKATKSTEREFNLLGRSITLDTKRIGAGLQKITAIAGVMFAAIAIASPSMRASFKQMELAVLEMNIALGEQLAPMLEQTVVPAMNKLRDIVLNLQPEQQAMIGLTITLAFVLGVLAIAIAAVTWEIILVAAIIAVVAIAIAGLIIYWDDITAAITTFISKIPGIESFMASIIDLKDAVLRFWEVAKPIFKLLLVVALIAIVPLIAAIIVAVTLMIMQLRLIIPVIVAIMDIFTSMLNFVSGVMEAIGLLLTGNFDDAFLKIKETIGTFITDQLKIFTTFANSVKDILTSTLGGVLEGVATIATGAFSGILNNIIDFLNDFVVKNINKALAVLDDLPVVSVSWRMSEIPQFQEGGTVERTGLIFAHRGEEIVRSTEARQFREQRTSRSGGNTFIFYNTYKIGSISNRSQMLAYARETATREKNEMNRRFHA